MQLWNNTQVRRLKHAPSACGDPGGGGHAPRYPTTNGGARGRGGRRLRCWQQVALVTRCGGGKEGGGYVSRCPLSIYHLPHPANTVASCCRGSTPRTEEGGRLRSRITHRCSRLYECLHSCFLSQSTRVHFLSVFWESAGRVNTVVYLPGYLSVKGHLWPSRASVFPCALFSLRSRPKKVSGIKENRLFLHFSFSLVWLHLCARSL